MLDWKPEHYVYDKAMRKIILLTQIFLLLFIKFVYAEKIEKITISGNERISAKTIIIFGEINLEDDFNENKLNLILKNLYKTNYFEDVKINITNNILNVLVSENPIIQSIEIKGIKAKKLRDPILESLSLKRNNSFTEFAARKDRNLFLNILKNSGFYFAEVKLKKIENSNKTVSLIYDVELGERAKIKKILFIGDKKFKDRKLFRIIASEENKFWKFISDRKLLNQDRINLDKKLLEGFYKNKGYYNVKVESSFAKLLDNGRFDLIFNINAGEKFFFNDLKLNIPKDYDRNNFLKIDTILEALKNKPYSYNNIEKILEEIELVALNTEYESINATIEETILENNKINFSIFINEIQKQYVERINITGNNITREDVLRNKLILDEGDAFNKILHNKSINQLRSLNYFKSVNSEVVEGSSKNSKIINIEVEEKPTGEISAGAGFGTSGSTIGFAVKENNFLGRGIQFSTNLELSDESIRGLFSVAILILEDLINQYLPLYKVAKLTD